jgi:hypothetical protein
VQYEIEVNGRIRQVSVDRAGDRFAVSVDGRAMDVDARRLDGRTLSLIVGPGAASYDVGIVPDAATGMLGVRVGAAGPRIGNTARRGRSTSWRPCPARSCASP